MYKIFFSCLVTLLFSALVAILILYVSGYFDPAACFDGRETQCSQLLQLQSSRSQSIASAIGISLSAVGTLALVVTIFLSVRATNAAVEAAKAANVAVSLARETAERELRPSVSLEKYELTWFGGNRDSVTSWRIGIYWVNSGHSTARKIRTMTSHLLLDSELPIDFTYPDRTANKSETSLGNGKSFRMQSGPIPGEDIQSVIDGKNKLFVWSWVEYDGPTPRERYRSEFCARFDFWGTNSADGLSSSFEYVGPFNGVDEHSFKPPLATA